MSAQDDDLYGDLYGNAEEDVAPPAKQTASTSKPAGIDAPQSIATFVDGVTSARQATSLPAPKIASTVKSPGGTRADIPPEGRIEDGKMFIGGLSWETTDEGLKEYFEQYGPVAACSIMRDPNTGRSRGFAFLTFENPASVSEVMVREHYLDGKTIDPKRAIPKDSKSNAGDKLFIKGIPPGVTQPEFQDYFAKFGVLTDCTLMMDRDTRQHKGFGFVSYRDHETTERVLANTPYIFNEQQLEVRRSSHTPGDASRGRGRGRGGYGNNFESHNNYQSNQMQGGMQGGMMPFDPNAMAEYFKQMGWGQFNPSMLFMANPMMMAGGGGNFGGSMGMQMPGMDANAWQGQNQQQSGDSSGGRFSAPTSGPFSGGGSRGGRGGSRGGYHSGRDSYQQDGSRDGSGPVRNSDRSNSNYHPYSRN